MCINVFTFLILNCIYYLFVSDELNEYVMLCYIML